MKSTPHIKNLKITAPSTWISFVGDENEKFLDSWSSRQNHSKTEILFPQMDFLSGIGTGLTGVPSIPNLPSAPPRATAVSVPGAALGHPSVMPIVPTGGATTSTANADEGDAPGGAVAAQTSVIENLGSTMTLTNEGVEKMASQPMRAFLPRTLTNSANDATLPSIKFYLAKPIKVATGLLSATDVPGTFTKYGVFDVLKTNPLYYNKLVGSFSFRADTVVTLQVNANRFQAGRYILAYLP